MTEDTYRGETNEPDSQNLYAYCAGNPVNYVDPSGHGKESSMLQNVGKLRVCTDGKIKNTYEKKLCNPGHTPKHGPYSDGDHQCDLAGFTYGGHKISSIASDEIPYIVVPMRDRVYKYGLGVIENTDNGNYLYCVIADVGPNKLKNKKNGLGEVSIYAAWKMKGKSTPAYNKRVPGSYKIGNKDQAGHWRIYAYKKAAPNPKATFGGWSTKPKTLKQQIKKIGKKIHTSVSKKGHCLN